MQPNSTGIALLIGAAAAVLVLAAFLVLEVRAGLTDPDVPLQVQLIYPPTTPQPDATPLPTPTPRPIPSSDVVLRLADGFDTLDGLADENFQQGVHAFAEADFIGLGASVSDNNTIRFPVCAHAQGWPWFRVALAWPATFPLPTTVHAGGLNIMPALAVQTVGTPAIPVVLEIGGAGHHLLVSRARLDCRLFGGVLWQVE